MPYCRRNHNRPAIQSDLRPFNQNSDGLTAFEDFLLDSPQRFPVASWRVGALDLWPILLTCLLSLRTQIHIGQNNRGLPVGGARWRAAVRADMWLYSRMQSAIPRSGDWLPPDLLDGVVLCHASGLHLRRLGNGAVAVPIDVPALILQQAGYPVIAWFDDVSSSAPDLRHRVCGHGRGLAAVSAVVRARVAGQSSGRKYFSLPEFHSWAGEAAEHLGLSNAFLRLWLARQINLAFGYFEVYRTIFDRRGTPRILVMVNSGFANTAGPTAAAKTAGVPVIEVQHGAESRAAITAAGQVHHFSSFNTAPDRLVGWTPRSIPDPRFMSVGPVTSLFDRAIVRAAACGSVGRSDLNGILAKQDRQLDVRVKPSGCEREILISLQPGDDGAWLSPLIAAMPDLFFWVRSHGADTWGPMPGLGSELELRVDTTLASDAFLPALLRRCSAHVTRFSAVVLEAAAMGVPSIVTDRYALALFADSVPHDLLAFAATRDALPGVLRGALLARQAATPVDDCVLDRLLAFLEEAMADGRPTQ